MFLNEELRSKLSKIEVTEEGRDTEYWGGFYGSEFSGEKLYLEIDAEEKEKNLLLQFQVINNYLFCRIASLHLRQCARFLIMDLGTAIILMDRKSSKGIVQI